MTASTIAFSGSALDRADHIRANSEKLAELTNWRARLLKLDGLAPVIAPEGGLEWGTLADADPAAELVFLGLSAEGRACFAAVSPALIGSVAPPSPALWQVMSLLAPDELATYGGAKALVDWHARHRFCARCGSATVLAKGGWQRNCTNGACKGEHFPRVDPVTIMTVECDGTLLLGRQPRFPPRRFSALAGFVEPGETIEEAVAREVHEEAGVRVRDVTYVCSQPWPFPSSLMIACHAHADDPALTIDETELDDARWFSRAEVAHAMSGAEDGAFIAPPPFAVAHHLLKWWLEQ
ncbi:NAD(+) diphosphatase [Novosphingobium cyanobacteriorum]|uniref:NAD(+) diphosphatase n=1 Tax=Novosphingobium cyanobacteriorum TaxID=3024215 RepID=A0ABT6CGH7_9SPHN|nr:NAD(+) diphosphatase [Novosphingobium cyanobacteriorum]MDF8332573.1 NAD(+) diphosphatase [Novosphingobium cyanobacteriorum]